MNLYFGIASTYVLTACCVGIDVAEFPAKVALLSKLFTDAPADNVNVPLTTALLVIVVLPDAFNVIPPAFDNKLIDVALVPWAACNNIDSNVPPLV